MCYTCSSTETFLTFHMNSVNANANAIPKPTPNTTKIPPTLSKANSFAFFSSSTSYECNVN